MCDIKNMKISIKKILHDHMLWEREREREGEKGWREEGREGGYYMHT